MTDFKHISLRDHGIAALWILLIVIAPLEHVPGLRLSLLVLLFAYFLFSQPKALFCGFHLALPILAWAAFCTTTLLWSIRPQSTLFHIKADLLPSLIAFALFFRIAQTKCATPRMALALLGCALVNAFVTLFGHLANIATIRFFYADVGFSSTIAVLTLSYAVAHLLFNFRNKLAWATLAFSLLAGVASANRMFFVIAIPLAGLLLLQLAFYRRQYLAASLFVGALLIVAALAFTLDSSSLPGLGAIQAKIKPTDVSKDPRFAIWAAWIGYAADYCWLGIGYGRNVGHYTFGKMFEEELRKIDFYSVMHSHNIFLNAYVETGLVGLTLFVLMCGYLIFRFGRRALHNVDALAGLFIVLGFIAKNMTDIFFLKSTMVLTMALFGFYLGRTLTTHDDKSIYGKSD